MSLSTMRWVGLTLLMLSGTAALAFVHERNRTPEQWRAVSMLGRQAPRAEVDLTEWLLRRAEQLAARELTLDAGDVSIVASWGALGIELDAQAARTRIVEATPPDTLMRQMRRRLGPVRVLTEVEAPVSLNTARARRYLASLAPDLEHPPLDAKLDTASHQVIVERPGRRLDIEASLKVLDQFVGQPTEQVSLVFEQIAPQVRRADLPPVDVSKVLASYETDFRRKAGPRATNIRRAAELLNGAIIEPGTTFSFNHRVGKRTHSRGFVDAPVIIRDEMEPGVGGGVCQVATTLHAAAVFGDLTIRERRSHSRPSGYAPLGLDATVLDGEVDLRVENPYPEPVMIRAFLPSRYVVRVELLGTDPPGRIEHRYTVLERQAYYRRIVQKDSLAPGAIERTQKGSYGYETLSRVVLHRPDGSVSRRRYRSKYYPVPEVFWVAPGVPFDELPPLPDGATHVEM